MTWKDIITAWSSQALQKRGLPVLVKELSWRLITNHKHFRVGIGLSLAILVATLAVYGPLPSFAGDSVGGKGGVNIHPEGEVILATLPSVQLPVHNFRLTQGYNWYHPGIDLAAHKGEPVNPVMPGQVTEVEYDKFGYGNHVEVAHANGYVSLYAHLAKIEVTSGQTVDMNTEIGQVGSTGHSTGPHLHLEVSVNGATVNPKTFLDLK